MSDNIAALFGQDLTNVSLDRPLLARGAVAFRVTSCGLEDTKDKSSKNIVIKLATANEEKSSKGEPIKPGYKLTHYINLSPTSKKGDERTDMIVQDLKRFRLACTGSATGSFGDPANYIGSLVVANIDIEDDANSSFGPQNRIKSFVAPGTAKQAQPAL
jgi:hypothetical protein